MDNSPTNRFSLNLSLSPLSACFEFFYNSGNEYKTIDGWAIEGTFDYYFTKNFALAIQVGFTEFFNINNKNYYQVPLSVLADFYIPFRKGRNVELNVAAGGGVMVSNLINKADINYFAQVQAGLNIHLKESVALNMRSVWRTTIPVKYLDKTMENVVVTTNTLFGLSYQF